MVLNIVKNDLPASCIAEYVRCVFDNAKVNIKDENAVSVDIEVTGKNELHSLEGLKELEYYFRFSSVRLNRLRNKLLANYLKSGGNELATVRISAFCVAMLSNNSFICKYSIFFRKYELSAAVL